MPNKWQILSYQFVYKLIVKLSDKNQYFGLNNQLQFLIIDYKKLYYLFIISIIIIDFFKLLIMIFTL